MKIITISEQLYKRFMRRYNKLLTDHAIESYSISAIQWINKDNKIVISCKYEKIGGIVSKSFFYNRISKI